MLLLLFFFNYDEKMFMMKDIMIGILFDIYNIYVDWYCLY